MKVDHEQSDRRTLNSDRASYRDVTRAIVRALRRLGEPTTPGIIHRLTRRFMASGEPDPFAYVLTYADPTGERATIMAARTRGNR